jgi:hypothetical protein
VAQDWHIQVGDILIDDYNDEIGVLIRQYVLLDKLKVWDVHWTKRNDNINEHKVHHYEEDSLKILINEGTLRHFPGT